MTRAISPDQRFHKTQHVHWRETSNSRNENYGAWYMTLVTYKSHHYCSDDSCMSLVYTVKKQGSCGWMHLGGPEISDWAVSEVGSCSPSKGRIRSSFEITWNFRQENMFSKLAVDADNMYCKNVLEIAKKVNCRNYLLSRFKWYTQSHWTFHLKSTICREDLETVLWHRLTKTHTLTFSCKSPH